MNVFVPENATFGANRFARRPSKNSGGGIRSAAIAGLIEAMFSSVNAFLGATETGLVALNDAAEVEFPAFDS